MSTAHPPSYRIFRDSWVRGHLRPYGPYFAQVMLVTAAAIAINFSIPLLNRAVVNDGILMGDPLFINAIIAIQALLYVFLIFLNLLRTSVTSHVSNRLLTRMAGEYAGHIVHLPMAFFQTARSGEIVERMRDLERVQRFASVELVEAFASSISIMALGLLLCWIDVAIFIVFAASAAAYLAWVIVIGKRRRAVDAERFREAARSRGMEIGIVEAIQDIKIAGFENRSLAAWGKVQVAALATQLKAASIENMQAAGGQVCNRTGMLLITFISAKGAVAGSMTLGDFMITLTVSLQLYFYINQLLDFVNRLDDVRAALRRAEDVRRLEVEDRGTEPRRRLSGHHTIDFRDISFSYPGAPKPSITAVAFVAPPGSMTALVGPSGSGKSSILKLLLKLYEPSAGAIFFGTESLTDIGHQAWREQTGAVMQDGALFAATLRENIIAGRGADEGWLAEVLRASCLEEVVAGLASGPDTIIGPAGEALSAGQVQRILIARALYKRPKLLLLDEATSALDGSNESAITASLSALLPGVTSIVAAHRLHTLVGADQVLVLDSGRLVQQGTADLLAAPGRFGLSGLA